MKPLALLLALSIAANAALAFFLVRVKGTNPDGSFSLATAFHRADSPTASGATKTASGEAPKGDLRVADLAAFAGLDAKTWSTLQSGDLKVLVERLRAAGFPQTLIRSIVAAQIRERYQAQAKALLAAQPEEPFWQRGNFPYDPKLMSALRSLSKQQSAELKSLVGTDPAASDENSYWRRRQFGELSAEKSDQAQDIVRDYSDLRSEIQAAANGVMLPEDREKLALLEKEQRADLAAVLTPEELENYELRSSTTASMLRSQLTTFKPSEQEFRAMFDAMRTAEAQYGSVGMGMGYATGDQMTKMRDAVLTDLQSQMSPDRLAELKQATDPRYMQTNRLVSRLGLPSSTSVDVANIQQDIMQRAMTLRRDTSLDAQARTAQLSALSQEAATKLSTSLTPRGYEAYKQYGGYWLQNLNPPQQRRTTTTP